MSEIKSLSIERQIICGILKYPNKFYDISNLLTPACFSSVIYKTLFSVISNFINSQKSLDSFLIAQEINKLGIKLEVDNIIDHLESLRLINISDGALDILSKQLRTIFHRRELIEVGRNIINIAERANDQENLIDIIRKSDQVYNGTINPWYSNENEDENLMEGLMDYFMDKANNPVESLGLLGPHKEINRICGSLLRPSHYSVIAARSGYGKTSWMMDYAIKTSETNNIIVLWLDRGEMTSDDLRGRIGASITDINMNLLETGKFMSNKSNMDKMLRIKDKENKVKIIYKNAATMSPQEIMSTIRRFIYKYVGRHNPNKCFVVLDYIKIGMNKGNRQEYVLAGELMSMLKDFLSQEKVALLTSLQVNRFGVVTGKKSSDVNDSEESFGLTDEILRQSGHSFIWRELTMDEQQEDSESTHKLIPLKMRFWGDHGIEFKKPVKVGKKLVKNFLRFQTNNFRIDELGTYRDFAAKTEFNEAPEEDKKITFEIP